jgi:hypothetical protein
MHPGYFGLIAQTGGAGVIEPWHLEYIAAAGVIVTATVGLITIWKHAANDFIRVTASAVVVVVVASGVLLAVGPMSYRLVEIRQRIARFLPIDTDAPSAGSVNAPQSLFSGTGAPSLISGSGGPTLGVGGDTQASPTPYYQQLNPPFYAQSNPAAPARNSPTTKPEFGGSVSNPYGGAVANPTGTPK